MQDSFLRPHFLACPLSLAQSSVLGALPSALLSPFTQASTGFLTMLMLSSMDRPLQWQDSLLLLRFLAVLKSCLSWASPDSASTAPPKKS